MNANLTTGLYMTVTNSVTHLISTRGSTFIARHKPVSSRMPPTLSLTSSILIVSSSSSIPKLLCCSICALSLSSFVSTTPLLSSCQTSWPMSASAPASEPGFSTRQHATGQCYQGQEAIEFKILYSHCQQHSSSFLEIYCSKRKEQRQHPYHWYFGDCLNKSFDQVKRSILLSVILTYCQFAYSKFNPVHSLSRMLLMSSLHLQ